MAAMQDTLPPWVVAWPFANGLLAAAKETKSIYGSEQSVILSLIVAHDNCMYEDMPQMFIIKAILTIVRRDNHNYHRDGKCQTE